MLDDIWTSMNTANEDYINEVHYWLTNPQNTCDHSDLSYRFKDEDHMQFDIVCNKCGKVIDTYEDFSEYPSDKEEVSDDNVQYDEIEEE